MDILESINKKLAVMGESYDELKPFLQTYLQRIETIINERERVHPRICVNLHDGVE